jgi:hypothetical protein
VAASDFEVVVTEYQAGADLSEFQGFLYGGQTYDYNYYHVAFDFKHLENLLHEAGFIDLKRYDYVTFFLRAMMTKVTHACHI